MQGPNIYDEENMGIIPRMIETVFEGIDKADEDIEFTLQVSFMEIYMERIRVRELFAMIYNCHSMTYGYYRIYWTLPKMT